MKRKLRFLVVLIALLQACAPAVHIPETFETYVAKDGTFQCDCPSGWTVTGGGKRNAWARFVSGSANVRLWTDVAGSMIGTIAGQELPTDDSGLIASPAMRVHSLGLDRVAQEFEDLQEDGALEVFECDLGDACRTVFTTTTAFGTTLKGYRATVLMRDKRLVAACYCSEEDWNGLQPVFDRVLSSLARGR